MASFESRPTADDTNTGWFREPASGGFWDKIDDGFPGYNDATYVSALDSAANIIFDGSSLPGDFPSGGADSIDYSIRIDLNSTKASPDPGFKIEVRQSDGSTVIATMSERAITSASFVTLTGTLSITGTNTDTSWTGHTIAIQPYDNDGSTSTYVYVADLELTVNYTVGGGGGSLVTPYYYLKHLGQM